MTKYLIGVDVGNYTFVPAERKVIISGISPLSLEQVLLITNVAQNVIIYNFAESNLGASISIDNDDTILVLDYDTTGMSATDPLQIWVDIKDKDLPIIISKLGLGDYYTNDLDDYSEENIMYIGKEKDDGTWLIMKLNMTSGTIIRGASSINNSTYSTYTNAWNNRTTLNYNYLKEVL